MSWIACASMSPDRARWRGLALASALAGGIAASAQGPELPAGPGADVMRGKCLTCHGVDLIQQQRLTRSGWEREVDKMVRWGAHVTDVERNALIDYLAANWRVASGSGPSAAADTHPGAEAYRRRCLVCHGSDLVEQQRLSRMGWEREVDKMIRWGAGVSEVEKGPLVDYLVSRSPRGFVRP
jgi:mono/diheme cytochrome c family protein